MIGDGVAGAGSPQRSVDARAEGAAFLFREGALGVR
jgi:hypothetical protein